jgi:DNA-cytosine methyltransferase
VTDATHASFFSGVGGLDLGLERAGWRTVSFSEIDPYASAVLAERWPGVPNLGDVVRMAAGQPGRPPDGHGESAGHRSGPRDPRWQDATLWSGGFPCQDLSVAGKRRGLAGSRSGLAFSFLELVGRHRPRFVLLENVPGLLSSHAGRDFGTLLAALVELGYGVGYRVLDARYFGVPQRRRRVFILGDSTGGRAGAEFAAEVLSVGSRCRRHPPTGVEAGEEPADRARPGVDIARTVVGTAGKRHDEDIDTLIPDLIGTLREHVRPGSNTDHTIIGPSPDPDGVRAADGLARGSHDRDGLAYVNAFDQRRGGADDNEAQAGQLVIVGRSGMTDDPLLPLGLDSHRYRCCGNGVVADVAEFIGARLLAAIESVA